MAMTRGTALVATVARVVQLTGIQDLANLEADAELTLTDLLVSASDAIYDQLEADGVEPTLITNEVVFEDAVAWQFLARLVILGYLPVPEGLASPQNPYEWSDPYYQRRRAKFADEDESRRPHEVLPAVKNPTATTSTTSTPLTRTFGYWGYP